MCFSSDASFIGGVIILSIGVVTVRKVHKPSQLVFAFIPLFFGLQQIAEGFLWVSLQHPEYLVIQKFSTYAFLIMAEVLWPTMIPLAFLYMEENKEKRKIMWILLVIGAILSVYYAICLVLFKVNPQIVNYHIKYNSDFPKSIEMGAFTTYLAATLTPFFVSSIKRAHFLGILMFLSCVISAIFFTQYHTSVWCFFAAIISGVIYLILRDSKIKFNLDKLNLLKSKIGL